jgi:hypothetical protein
MECSAWFPYINSSDEWGSVFVHRIKAGSGYASKNEIRGTCWSRSREASMTPEMVVEVETGNNVPDFIQV